MTQEEFVQKLKNDVVMFSFRKKDGTERRARGTLKMELIPPADHPRGEASGDASVASLSTNQKYYDLEKNAWRCFDWKKFISLI